MVNSNKSNMPLYLIISAGVSLFTVVIANGLTERKVFTHYETKQCEQVFRDYYGYSVYSLEDKILKEEKYDRGKLGIRNIEGIPDSIKKEFLDLETPHHGVEIVKDLPPQDTIIAKILKYRIKSFLDIGFRYDMIGYVEIHMPKNQPLSAGIDEFGSSKSYGYDLMKEIK